MRKRIDLSAILMGSPRSPSATAAYRVGVACMNGWKAKARQVLTDVSPATRQEYIRQIRLETAQRGVRVALRGFKSNLIEQGMGPGGVGTQGTYDARKFLLKPPFARVGGVRRNGYKVIPFSRGGISTVGRNYGAGARRAAMAAAAAGGGRIRAGVAPFGRRRGLGSAQRDVMVRDAATGRMVRFHAHAVDAMAGAKVEMGTYSAASGPQARITALRAMSARGKPWMTRGVRARRVVTKLDWQKILEQARRAGRQP